MQAEERKALSQVRLEHAEECFVAARSLLQAEAYKSAANRAYYTIFHAMRAVLALDEYDSKKHSGVIAEFRKRYIKTGIFSSELSAMITSAFDARTDSDYNDFYIISKSKVVSQVRNAEIFLSAVQNYLNSL